jgi:hypothetical protein
VRKLSLLSYNDKYSRPTCYRAAIEKLRIQNEQLKNELLLENKFSVRPGDPHAQALINRLQDEGDMLARQVGAIFATIFLE